MSIFECAFFNEVHSDAIVSLCGFSFLQAKREIDVYPDDIELIISILYDERS